MVIRILTLAAIVTVICASRASGQPPASAGQPSNNVLNPLMNMDTRLTASLTVQANATVEAVLLPPNVTRGVFGRAVSDRYAAVALTISNRSDDAALVVHSIFIDYSRWLFSGTSSRQPPACDRRDRTGRVEESEALFLPDCLNPLQPWQAATNPSQIAALEYRIPRAQLLDAQPWSWRNWIVRSAELVGSVAAGYLFTVREVNAAKSVAAYNGNFLPALRNLIPDQTIDQANRISDFGFRVNKIIPKQSSEVLVAFFPLDRFLTPGVKRLFEKSPAIFFVPQSVLFDPDMQKIFLTALNDPALHLDERLSELRRLLLTPKFKDGKEQRFQDTTGVLRLLDRISLNNIRLIVGGTMTVDLATVPASIEEPIEFDEADPAMLWLETGPKKGTIHGRYLAGGQLTIVNATELQVSDVSTIAEGSTEHKLRFQFTVNKPVPRGSKIILRVDKGTGDARTKGIPFDYEVKDVLLVAPAIDKSERSDNTLTLTGKRFFSNEVNALTVTLAPGSVAGVPSKPVAKFARTPTTITIDLAPMALPPACWTAEVSVGTMKAVAPTAFAQPPAPKIATAIRNGTRVVVTGEQFLDLKACGKPLTFEIAERTAGATFTPVSQLTVVSPKEVSFDYPTVADSRTFKVRVLVGGVEASTKDIN